MEWLTGLALLPALVCGVMMGGMALAGVLGWRRSQGAPTATGADTTPDAAAGGDTTPDAATGGDTPATLEGTTTPEDAHR